MACEEEKFQVEILEILLQSQDNQIGETYDKYHAALEMVEEQCVAIHFIPEFHVREECRDALLNANQLYDEIWAQESIWRKINQILEQARNRYADCLHEQKAGIPDD